jgi:hypothetical protein
MRNRRPAASEYNARFNRYIDLVPEVDLPKALAQQIDDTGAFLGAISEAVADTRYAPGKWTIRQVVGHIVDTERILGYRLLCFARGDEAILQRADEELYVKNADFNRYSLGELLDEFSLIRRSHVSMIRHLPVEAWDRTGTVSEFLFSVRAMGYMVLGHERHHLGIIQRQYLSGIPQRM